jgi:hypothetical protein
VYILCRTDTFCGGLRKIVPAVPEGATEADTGVKPLRNRLPARIFTVDIPPRESTIPAVRFPNPV